MFAIIKQNLSRNLSNLPGWRTKRHIVVIESDDWGSIRMSSKESFHKLKQARIDVDKNHYNTNDALESNTDLEMLMEILYLEQVEILFLMETGILWEFMIVCVTLLE